MAVSVRDKPDLLQGPELAKDLLKVVSGCVSWQVLHKKFVLFQTYNKNINKLLTI